MNKIFTSLLLMALTLGGSLASADEYSDAIDVFKNAGESTSFFSNSYGYAVFPSIGKGGLVVGAAHGDGRVYAQGKFIGTTSMTQVSVGFQAGGEAFRQIIFFENKAALDQFTSGNFEFGADVNAVAIRSGVSGSAGTTGATGTASTAKHAASGAKYYKGMAVFTVVKGGAMVKPRWAARSSHSSLSRALDGVYAGADRFPTAWASADAGNRQGKPAINCSPRLRQRNSLVMEEGTS